MPALIVKDVTKTYRNNVHALKSISFTVEHGDFFALLGPNGAGKSTLIGIITSLVNKSSGKIIVGKYDIDTHFIQAKTRIGVVPQEFNFNVFQKVQDIVVQQAGYYGIPRRVAVERSERYLHELDLWDKRNSISRSLSGGMKRRLMIARALMNEPDLLILDEPTAGVDIEVRRSMWKFLTEINRRGTTIILTTHYLEEAEQLCRHVAIIDKGEIILHKSMPDVLKQLERESFIFGTQEALPSDFSLKNYSIRRIENNIFEVEISIQQGLNALFQELTEKNIRVTSLRNKSNRLEELFVHLTGKK